MIYQIEHGTFVLPQTLTIEEYLSEWLEVSCKQKLTVCTYAGYKVNIEKHINPTLGKIPLQKLQPVQIQRLYNAKMEGDKPLSATSIRYIHAVLNKALNHAIKMQYIQRNPCEAVEVPKVKKAQANFLNKQQISEVLEAFKGSDIYLPTLLAIGLGVRRGELLGLQWKDIDFEKRLVSIERSLLPIKDGDNMFSECKTEKSHRTLAVSDNILFELKQARKKQLENKFFFGEDFHDYDLVYANPDGSPITPHAFNHRFTNALKKHNLPHIRVHDLRHSHVKLKLKNKCKYFKETLSIDLLSVYPIKSLVLNTSSICSFG